MSAGTDGSWNEGRVRTRDLAREPRIPIDLRASEHTTSSHEAAALVTESETEFYVSDDQLIKDRILGRDERTKPAHYGAITQGLAPQDERVEEEDENRSLVPTDRKRSAAMAGKAYEKIASRNKRAEHATTNIETAMHLLKGNVGIGLLALPLAVYNAGILVGGVGLFVMGLIATHCMMQLVACSKELCRRLEVETLDYAEVAQFAVLECTGKHALGIIGRYTVNTLLLITQFGFCCAYFVFMAYSFDQVFCITYNVNLGQRAWIGFIMMPVVVFSWIRNLNQLAYLSMVANVCVVITLVIILYEEVTSFITTDEVEKAAVFKGPLDLVSVTTLPLFFGKAVYAYEGIGIILPLENKMKNHKDALRVIFFSMMLVTFLFTLFGVAGYIVYGSDIKASITLNLISSNIIEVIFYIIAKILFAYATFASFLLQFYVPMDFLEPAILGRMKLNTTTRSEFKVIVQVFFRSVTVLFIAGVAMAVPDLDDLISLIGAIASSGLALIFPSILSILIFWRVRKETLWLGYLPWPVWMTKDILIALLGVLGTVFGTYAAINNIIGYFKNTDNADKACDVTYFPT